MIAPLGASPLPGGMTEFRVWAPRPKSISLQVGGSEVQLAPGPGDTYASVAPARAGDDYVFVVDGEALPDPCSRWQPYGIQGPSRVAPVHAPSRAGTEDLVIYELHIGAFTEQGTFDAAIPHLRQLAELGVSAILVMPVAEFPGRRGWGYDGLYISAAHSAYGGPQGFARLVDAAHRSGLAVLLDVVYNHVGGTGAGALEAFGPYFRGRTLWGPAPDFSIEAVREWVLQSAEGWVRDFGVDGLRLDAIHAIDDPAREHIVASIVRRVHAIREDAVVIGEIGLTNPRAHGAPACDLLWTDDFHHALHALLTGERDGYYRSFGSVARLAEVFAREPPGRRVAFAQNHDQIGNRAIGDRLARELRPLAAFCTLLSQFVPLVFMGEEYGEPAPFRFFCDHTDARVAAQTRAGRRREFASFHGFSGELPDPQARATFERSKLTRRRDEPLAALYEQLLRARRRLPPGAPEAVLFDERQHWLRVRRGPFELVCNFAAHARGVACEGSAVELATCPTTDPTGGYVELQPMSGALIR